MNRIDSDSHDRPPSPASDTIDSAHLRAVKETSSVWFWEQDSEFRFTVDVRGKDHMPGERSIIGKRRWETPDCVPLQGTWDDHRRCLEARLPFRNFEFRARRGVDVRYISSTGVPVFDADGRFTGYRGTAVDVTEIKHAHQAKKRAQALSSLAGRLGKIAGWSFDRVHGSIEWSSEAGALVDLQEHLPVRRSSVLRLLPKDVRRQLMRAIARCAESETPFDLELRVQTAGGVDRCVRLVGEPVRVDGRVERIEGAVQDIWEAKQAQERLVAMSQQLASLNSELGMRVQERTRELECANGELKAFAHALAHDLKSPLAAIDGFSTAMEEALAQGDHSQCARWASRIRAGGARMTEYVDALLSLAETSQARLRIERVDLSALCTEVLDELRQAQPGRHVEAAVEPGMVAMGDRRLLRVLLENLLGNAWKFTSRRAEARIRVDSRADAPGPKVFSVHDNGAGFDMAFADRLFGNFQRLHSHGEFPGTGVGLANAQRIVTRHGGRIWAESRVDAGATFSFALGAGLGR